LSKISELNIRLDDDGYYLPLTSEEKYILLEKIQKSFHEYMKSAGISTMYMKCRVSVLLDIIEKVEKRRVYFHVFHRATMSESDEMSLYCFWILKLTPFFNVENPDYPVNAFFALFIFLKTINNLSYERLNRAINLDKEYVDSLIYAFQYRDLSKEAIMAIAEALLTGEYQSSQQS